MTVGEKAPGFSVVDKTFQQVTLADSAGKIRLITVVPSLDAPVSDIMIRQFNQVTTDLPEDVVVYAISLDLPFAQKRWSDDVGIDNVDILSDYQDRSFGLTYGLLIDELKLLTRAVIVVDQTDTISYLEIVREVTAEPDYEEALAAVQKLL